MKGQNRPCEGARHCRHPFDGAADLYFCCREDCFDILRSEVDNLEEKTHGGLIFSSPMPKVTILKPRPKPAPLPTSDVILIAREVADAH